jgi:flagellar basal-body rod protein FlgB
MFPTIFRNPTFESIEKTISFAERRHSILAGNIANQDTPGYQSRDLSVDDFQKGLKEVFESQKLRQQESPSLRLSLLQDHEPQSVPSPQDLAVEKVHDAMRQVVYNDGSNDNLEMQVTQIAKNQSMHNMAVALMRSQFQTLQMAISESVNV